MDAYGKSQHEPRLLKIIEGMFDPMADRQRLNQEYIAFFNERLSAPRQVRTQGLDRYNEHSPYEHIHQMQVWSECKQKSYVVQVSPSLEGQTMNVLVVPPDKARPGLDPCH